MVSGWFQVQLLDEFCLGTQINKSQVSHGLTIVLQLGKEVRLGTMYFLGKVPVSSRPPLSTIHLLTVLSPLFQVQ